MLIQIAMLGALLLFGEIEFFQVQRLTKYNEMRHQYVENYKIYPQAIKALERVVN
jgi:hypothetical protein